MINAILCESEIKLSDDMVETIIEKVSFFAFKNSYII